MIKTIFLQNWKNIVQRTIDLEKGINIIIGENGSGKTSILDAIFFGFTNQLKYTKAYKSLKRIESEENAIISIEIDDIDKNFIILREFHEKFSKSNIIQNGIKIHRNKDVVNQFILDHFNIQDFLFKNLIYSSEGEIYKMQDISNQREFSKFIDEILGLNKLIELGKTAENLNSFLSNERKKIKIKMEEIRDLQIDSDLNLEDLNYEIKEVEEVLNTVKKEVYQKNQEFNDLKSKRNTENDIIKQISKKYESFKEKMKLTFNNDIFNIEQILKYEKKIEDEVQELELKIAKSIKKVENLGDKTKRKELGLEDIESKLEIYHQIKKNEDVKINCPICEKFLSKNEISILYNKNKNLYKKINQELSNLKDKERNATLEEDINNKKMENLETMLQEIGYFRKDINYFKIEGRKKRIINLQRELDSVAGELENLEKIKVPKNEKLIDLTKKKLMFKASIKLQKIENYENNLQATIKGEFFNSIILEAIENLSKGYRTSIITDLIYNLNIVWKNYFPNDLREFSLDENFYPILKYRDSIVSYNELSSGEKTFLLVILKTLILKFFSTIPFLILDEPIEHLDENNRIIIIDYLYESVRNGLIDQIILTTYEESIVRKFIHLDQANIISLDK